MQRIHLLPPPLQLQTSTRLSLLNTRRRFAARSLPPAHPCNREQLPPSCTGIVRRNPPDRHTHTKLRALPSHSRDLSVMVRSPATHWHCHLPRNQPPPPPPFLLQVQPIFNVGDGEEVEVLHTHGAFYKAEQRRVGQPRRPTHRRRRCVAAELRASSRARTSQSRAFLERRLNSSQAAASASDAAPLVPHHLRLVPLTARSLQLTPSPAFTDVCKAKRSASAAGRHYHEKVYLCRKCGR